MAGALLILLTGASQGIGKNLIDSLSKIDNVVGTYNSTLPPVSDSSKVRYEKVDLSNSESIEEMVERLSGDLGHLTIVHAAALSLDGLVAGFSNESWDHVFNVNIKSNFILTKMLLPSMIHEKWGRIIHVSSIVGLQGQRGTAAYSATKSGLIGFSRVLAKEYARFNITSNVLALGYFDVGLIETLTSEAQKAILDQIPSRSLGRVSNIAHAIDFLTRADYVNGAVINIDGGI